MTYAKVSAGDDWAFERLFRRYQKPLLNYIFRLVGELSEAEDLTQEVFLRIWQARKTYKVKGKFSNWVYKIANNLCLNFMRLRRRSSRCQQQPTVSIEGLSTRYSDDDAAAAAEVQGA